MISLGAFLCAGAVYNRGMPSLDSVAATASSRRRSLFEAGPDSKAPATAVSGLSGELDVDGRPATEQLTADELQIAAALLTAELPSQLLYVEDGNEASIDPYVNNGDRQAIPHYAPRGSDAVASVPPFAGKRRPSSLPGSIAPSAAPSVVPASWQRAEQPVAGTSVASVQGERKPSAPAIRLPRLAPLTPAPDVAPSAPQPQPPRLSPLAAAPGFDKPRRSTPLARGGKSQASAPAASPEFTARGSVSMLPVSAPASDVTADAVASATAAAKSAAAAAAATARIGLEQQLDAPRPPAAPVLLTPALLTGCRALYLSALVLLVIAACALARLVALVGCTSRFSSRVNRVSRSAANKAMICRDISHWLAAASPARHRPAVTDGDKAGAGAHRLRSSLPALCAEQLPSHSSGLAAAGRLPARRSLVR